MADRALSARWNLPPRRMLPTVALVVGVALGAASCEAARIVQGKLVQVQAGGIVVRSGGTDRPIPIAPGATVVVTAKADATAVADGAPCFADGTIMSGKQTLEQAGLQIVAAGSRVDPSRSHIRIESNGRLTFQNVPGAFRRGASPAFIVGPRVEHLQLTPDGRLVVMKTPNLSNQAIPLTDFAVEYHFGSNLQMAGKDADVTVDGNPNDPANWTITVVRTEPLAAPPGSKKK
jgi:hypothetical protein